MLRNLSTYSLHTRNVKKKLDTVYIVIEKPEEALRPRPCKQGFSKVLSKCFYLSLSLLPFFSVWRSFLSSSTSNLAACCPSSQQSLDAHGMCTTERPKSRHFLFLRHPHAARNHVRHMHSLQFKHVVMKASRPATANAEHVVDDLCDFGASLYFLASYLYNSERVVEEFESAPFGRKFAH